MKNIVVFGASSGGKLIANALARQTDRYNFVCFLDSDERLKGKSIYDRPVIGGINSLPEVILNHEIHEVIVAISNVEDEFLLEITNICNNFDVNLRVLPKALDILFDDPILNQLKNIDVVDLLGREEVKLDTNFLETSVKGRSILITGAAGSIGSEVVRQISKFIPGRIIALDLNENDLYLLELFVKRHYKQVDIVSVVGSIQDQKFIRGIFGEFDIDVVFHCAAHKHVPLMERYPQQAVKNNVYGTYVIASESKLHKVERFVLISTDKAVNPRNCMGASKRLAELISLTLNGASTLFMVVRFGNVLGSAGSVVPIFKQLLKEGKNLTVTDERMTRYFMTIPEAARLVVEAGFRGVGGELFVLDMGKPVKITELASKMIKLSGAASSIEYIGLRPGEKLYEELFYDKMLVSKTKNRKIMISSAESKVALNLDEVVSMLNDVIQEKICPRAFLKTFVETAEI